MYTYELYQPLLTINMRSKSQTIQNIAFEMTHIMAYLLRDQSPKANNMCVFNSDDTAANEIFEQLFT